jgi:hypothetical protein
MFCGTRKGFTVVTESTVIDTATAQLTLPGNRIYLAVAVSTAVFVGIKLVIIAADDKYRPAKTFAFQVHCPAFAREFGGRLKIKRYLGIFKFPSAVVERFGFTNA